MSEKELEYRDSVASKPVYVQFFKGTHNYGNRSLGGAGDISIIYKSDRNQVSSTRSEVGTIAHISKDMLKALNEDHKSDLDMAGNFESLAENFERLAEKWRQNTEYMSITAQMAIDPSYQQIIGMGRDALPHILGDLKITGDHWFWALEAIAPEGPKSVDYSGNIRALSKAWISWGIAKGCI